MQPFETVDELYYRQQGTEPTDVLVTAKSKDTGKDEPLAWAYEYGKVACSRPCSVMRPNRSGRRPGHPIRRGAPGRRPRAEAGKTACGEAGREAACFCGREVRQVLDARVVPVSIEGDDRYRKPPLTVECWARLFSKNNFNVLVSTDPKSSGQHWEIYTYAGKGDFSVLPGTPRVKSAPAWTSVTASGTIS